MKKRVADKKYYCDFCGDIILKGQKYIPNANKGETEHFDTIECLTEYKNDIFYRMGHRELLKYERENSKP
jgi:hypothetical protein